MRVRALTRFVIIPVTAAIVLCGCSGGGGTDKPSVSEIATKLQAEPELETVKVEAGAKFDTYVDCLATFLHQSGNPDDLRDYVDGERTVAQVRSIASVDAKTAEASRQNCTNMLGLDS